MDATVENLRDIRLPDPPPSPDLTSTLVLIAVALLLAALLARRYWPTRRAWVRWALAELNGLENLPIGEAAIQAARVMRRLALHLSSSPDARHAYGQPWLEQLDRIFRTDFFTRGAGRRLGASLYAPETSQSTEGSAELVQGLRRIVRRRSWRR